MRLTLPFFTIRLDLVVNVIDRVSLVKGTSVALYYRPTRFVVIDVFCVSDLDQRIPLWYQRRAKHQARSIL